MRGFFTSILDKYCINGIFIDAGPASQGNIIMTVDQNKWYQSLWLPFAAATYIIICIFDFMVMPIYVAAHNSKIEAMVFQQLEKKDIATFAATISQTAQATKQWNPLTLLGAGMFHMAFGALLTGGAVTRGLAKKSELEGYYKYGAAGYEDLVEYPTENRGYRENAYGHGAQPENRYRNERRSYHRDTSNDGPMPRTTDMDDDA